MERDNDVAFSPDSKYLHSVPYLNAKAGKGGMLVRTEVKNCKEKHSYSNLSSGYTDINFSPYGRYIASIQTGTGMQKTVKNMQNNGQNR